MRTLLLILTLLLSTSLYADSKKHGDFHKYLNQIFHGHFEKPTSGAIITWNGAEWVPKKYSKYAPASADDVGEQLIWDGKKWIEHDGNDDDGVTSITAGNGLLADGILNGVITSYGVLSIDVGNEPGQIPQFNQDGDLVVKGGIIFSDGSILESASGIGGAGQVGPPGPQGEMGPMGPQGIQGEVGPIGPQGLQGEIGAVGPVGPQGLQGLQGEKGEQGVAGVAGIAGPVGPMGPQGIQGEVGPIGPQGLQGLQGEMGLMGLQGVAGPMGPQGAQGPQGIQGEMGPMGPQGLQGEIGPMGPQGLQGLQGEMGLMGLQGVAGPVGPQGGQGPQGIQGEMGPMGPQGPQGIAGVQGAQGEVGPMGPQGPAGLDATVSLQAGVGIVGYPAAVIGSTGTVSVDVGVGPNQIPQLDDNGKLNPSVIPSGVGGGFKTIFIKDVKPSGTAGGACTRDTWITRDLNSMTGEYANIASLSANYFTLVPGKYLLEASSPAFITTMHKIRLVNGGGSTVIVGSSGFSNTANSSVTHSFVMGYLDVVQATSYAIQHRCGPTATVHINDFGVPASMGENEIYTQVKITKVE